MGFKHADPPSEFIFSDSKLLDDYMRYCTHTKEGYNFLRSSTPAVLDSATQLFDGFVVLGQALPTRPPLATSAGKRRVKEDHKQWQAPASASASVLFNWRVRREGSLSSLSGVSVGSTSKAVRTPSISSEGSSSTGRPSDHADSSDTEAHPGTARLGVTGSPSRDWEKSPASPSNSVRSDGRHGPIDRTTLENTQLNASSGRLKKRAGPSRVHSSTDVPERHLWDTEQLVRGCFPRGIPCSKRSTQSFKGLSPVEEARYEHTHLKSEEGNAVLRIGKATRGPGVLNASEDGDSAIWAVCVYREEPATDVPSFCTQIDPYADQTEQHGKREETVTVRCYCLLSRFPFFELHFYVLYCLLEQERLYRLESTSQSLAMQVLREYSRLEVPRTGEKVTFRPLNGAFGSCAYSRPMVPPGLPWSHKQSVAQEDGIHPTVLESFDPVVEVLVQDCRGSISHVGGKAKGHLVDGTLHASTYRFRLNSSTYSDVSQWMQEAEEACAMGLWSIRALASSLSADCICRIMSAVLLEYQVIFIAENYGLVSGAVLSILPLLWPFRPAMVIPIMSTEQLEEFLPLVAHSAKSLRSRRSKVEQVSSPFVAGCVDTDTIKERARSCDRLMVVDLSRKGIVHTPRGLPNVPFHNQLVSELEKHTSKVFKSGSWGPSPLVRAANRPQGSFFGMRRPASSTCCKQPLHVMTEDLSSECASILGTIRQYISYICRQICCHTITQVVLPAPVAEPARDKRRESVSRGSSRVSFSDQRSPGLGEAGFELELGDSMSSLSNWERHDSEIDPFDRDCQSIDRVDRTRVLLEASLLEQFSEDGGFMERFIQTSLLAHFSLAARPSAVAMGRAFLAAMPTLTSLRMSTLERMLTNMRTMRRREGKIIFRQGSRPDGIYFVTRGKLGVYVNSSKRRGLGQQIAAVLPGQFFGEMSVLDDNGELKRRSATIRAETNVGLLFLPLKTWREVLDETPREKKRIKELVRRRRMENLLRADLNLVRLCPLFMETDRGIAELLLDRMYLTHLKAGQFAVRQGEDGDRMFYIVKGKVSVIIGPESDSSTDRAAKGQRIPLSIGDFFGEMALLEANNQRTADVQCDTDCDLLCLTSDDFTRVMAESEGKQTLERIYTIANERRKASQLISKGYKDMLKACNLFQNLPDDAIEQLFKEMDAVFKPSGAYIAREGEPGTCMWLVYNGQVDILKNEEGMESTIVSELGVGQYFGEIALLEEGGIRTADVRARGSVMLLKLEKESFERVRRHFREVDDMVIREASLRLQGLHAVTSRSALSKSAPRQEGESPLPAPQVGTNEATIPESPSREAAAGLAHGSSYLC